MSANRAPGGAGRVAPIAVAAGSLLVGVGAAVAMVVTAGDVRAGRETPIEVAEATVAAFAAGDAERAVGLMPSYDELIAALDCPRVEDRHGRPSHEHARVVTWAKARVWAQRKPRLGTISPRETIAKDVDDELGRCRTMVPVAMQTIDVAIELDGGGHGQFDASLTMIKLGERWFLLDAGQLPSSLDGDFELLLAEREARRIARARDRGRDDDDDDSPYILRGFDDEDDAEDRSVWAAIGGPSSAVVARARALRDATCACQDVACLDRTERDLAAFQAGYDASDAPDDEHRGVTAALAERTACVRKVRIAAAPKTGVPECDEYVVLVQWYMTCDKIPQAARDGMDQGLDAMRQAWSDAANMSDSMREAMGEGCRSAVDALGQAAMAMGCGTPP